MVGNMVKGESISGGSGGTLGSGPELVGEKKAASAKEERDGKGEVMRK